jgi:D-alanyl-lipoteichoic acid acyltransferase DltB (MBOAT superfamily)
MIFNSVEFGIFFPLVFTLYYIFFNKKTKLRNIYLVAVSYLFYGWWDWRFLSLIVISSIADYVIGQKIFGEGNKRKRKHLLIFSLCLNLGLLGFFKYFNFFVDSFIDAFSLFRQAPNISTLSIILPVGISFYTFQTLSYTLDIYYERLKPTNDIFSFFAFVSFFPQLVAGPIERAKDLLPQFFNKRPITYELLRSGLLLMAWGFFKKMVIADRLAIFVDSAYGSTDSIDGITAVVAIIFFAFQLYLDFSAYSDIAIGSARMLGFNLSTNFRRPYLATSFSDFWQRWHISLSSWFRDYLYIPLGGNRVGKIKHVSNVLIVFMLSGLWHGASWNFVIWGSINGLFILVFEHLLRNDNKKIIKRILFSLFISTMWALSLVFFRAQTFNNAITIFSKIGNESQDVLYDFSLNSLEFLFSIQLLIGYIIFEIIQEKFTKIHEWFNSLNFLFRWSVYVSLIAAILFYGSYGVGLNDNNFIYFQF